MKQSSDIVQRLNKSIKHAIYNRISFKIPNLDGYTIRIVGFYDSYFENNHDLSTQLWNILFLADRECKSVLFKLKSYTSKILVRSAMTGEIIAFRELFDVFAALSDELKDIYNRQIPVQLQKDSKYLFDFIYNRRRTPKKIMLLHIAAAREGFRDKLIS